MPSASSCFFRVFDPFQRRILNGVQTERNFQKDFFPKQKKIGKPENQDRGPAGTTQALMARLGGPCLPGLWAPWASPSLGLSPINALNSQKKSGDHRKYFSAAASFCLRKIPSGARSGALPDGGFGYGGLLHQHHDLSDDA